MDARNKSNAMSVPKVFTFNPSNQPIQVVVINGEPYFVAKDVCDCLDIGNITDVMSRLEDDEKLTSIVSKSGQNRKVWIVNESGLYNLIFQSRKPEAKIFRKWVTGEVLPTLRKTGNYKVERRSSPRQSEFVDLRHIPYVYREFEKTQVRVVNFQDINWFSINDIFRCIGACTDASQTAKDINVVTPGNAIKIFIYGNTHPAWFTTLTGAQLIISGSRKLKNNKQQINQIQIMIEGV